MSQGFDLSFSLSAAGFSLGRRSVPSFVSWEHKLSIAERWQTSRKVFWRLVEVHHWQCWHWWFAWLQATGGEGVDVVLNSLSGKAIPASLNLCLSIIKAIKPHISIDIFDIWLLGSMSGCYSRGFATLGGSWRLANGISMKERKWNWHLSSKASGRADINEAQNWFPFPPWPHWPGGREASHTTRRTLMCWCSRDPTSAEGSWKRRQMGGWWEPGKGKYPVKQNSTSTRSCSFFCSVFMCLLYLIRWILPWGLGRAAESSLFADKDFWDGKSERPRFRKCSNKKANRIWNLHLSVLFFSDECKVVWLSFSLTTVHRRAGSKTWYWNGQVVRSVCARCLRILCQGHPHWKSPCGCRRWCASLTQSTSSDWPLRRDLAENSLRVDDALTLWSNRSLLRRSANRWELWSGHGDTIFACCGHGRRCADLA